MLPAVTPCKDDDDIKTKGQYHGGSHKECTVPLFALFRFVSVEELARALDYTDATICMKNALIVAFWEYMMQRTPEARIRLIEKYKDDGSKIPDYGCIAQQLEDLILHKRRI